MRITLVAICAFVGAAQAWAAPSTEELQTAQWASSCMACHGPDGKAEGTGFRLHGKNAQEIYADLLAFKTGKKAATIMHQHAKGYRDEELKRIAQYIAAIKK